MRSTLVTDLEWTPQYGYLPAPMFGPAGSLELTHLVQLKFCTHLSAPPHFLFPSLWQPQFILCFNELDYFYTACKWNQAIFVLWLAYFTQHTVVKVHSCCCIW